MRAATRKIPQALIYEMVDGKPIYYRGYRAFMRGERQIEELMASSYLQGLIVARLIILLGRHLDDREFVIISNEIGLQLDKKSWRAADIAVFSKSALKNVAKSNKYLPVPPELVIEVDTKADLEDLNNPIGYYQEKTDQLLEFGTQRVVWIFTETKKVMIAEKDEDWQIFSWGKTFSLFSELEIDIEQLIGED